MNHLQCRYATDFCSSLLMFALPSNEMELGDLQPLDEVIAELCRILGGDREILIQGRAEMVRRRAEFELLRQMTGDI